LPVQAADTATGLMPGTYTVTVTDANACSAAVDVTIAEPAVLTVSAVPADANCPDSPDGEIALNITGGTPVYSVFWVDGDTVLTKKGLLPNTYSVAVTDANGCATSTSAVVGFIGTYNCVEIPGLITPDPADGHNDEWRIRNIDIYPNAEVKVYSRWGKLIYHSKNPNADPWKGRYYNGKLVPTDSYHYILDLHDGSAIRSGVISVIR
jgi:gliding motility-associated-like protein